MTTDLDLIPERMRSLPRNAAGSPMPWGSAPDAYHTHLAAAVNEKRCWMCGEKLGKYVAFILGPRACLTRITHEPPSHLECALFVAQDVDSDHVKSDTGFAIVWTTEGYLPRPDGKGGTNFKIGDPETVSWFYRGWQARRSEAITALDAEFGTLFQLAAQEGLEAQAELAIHFDTIRNLVPIAE